MGSLKKRMHKGSYSKLNSGDISYHFAHNLWSSSLLSKNILKYIDFSFPLCSLWVYNLASSIKERSQTEGVRKTGLKERHLGLRSRK